jgi:hypothetical protein
MKSAAEHCTGGGSVQSQLVADIHFSNGGYRFTPPTLKIRSEFLSSSFPHVFSGNPGEILDPGIQPFVY